MKGPCSCVYFGGRSSTRGEPGVFCRRCGGAARDAEDYRRLTEAGAIAAIANLLRGLSEDDRLHLLSGLETVDDRLLELELALWRFLEINPTRADLEAQGVHLDTMARKLMSEPCPKCPELTGRFCSHCGRVRR